MLLEEKQVSVCTLSSVASSQLLFIVLWWYMSTRRCCCCCCEELLYLSPAGCYSAHTVASLAARPSVSIIKQARHMT